MRGTFGKLAVVNFRPESRTRYLRVLGLFTLLAGILVMHAVVFGMPHDHTGHAMPAGPAHAAPDTAALAHSANTQVIAVHAAAAFTGLAPVAVITDRDPAMFMAGCGGGDCGAGHAGMHGCLFVLAALLLAIGPALLGWVGAARREATRSPAPVRALCARPPPWTVLSLADLAILRI